MTVTFTRVIHIIPVILVLFLSCQENEKSKTRRIYPEYKIIAVEGNDNLAILAQFKDGDEFGEAISLEPPSSVTLDGEPMLPDTARFGGVYYELFKPLDKFEGNHIIEYSDAEGEKYKENFSFKPVALVSALPDTVSRGDLEMELTGLNSKELVRLLLTDTSFLSEGVNLADTIENGKLQISVSELNNLADGPVQLQLIREFEQPLKNVAGIAGKLIINYTLQREFFLKDN
ncbi:MAG: hypothetical protein IPH18_15535 [Chitinophagaceae bacterium]|nr:hypothetical protein [Chitinophagaceae bacterium]